MMIINDVDGKQIKVVEITEELYWYYKNLEKECNQYKFWFQQQKNDNEKFIEVLKHLYQYAGSQSDALSMKEDVAKVLWDTVWDVY